MFEAQNLKARLDQAGVETANAAEQFGNDLSKSLSKPFVTSPNISLDPLGAALAGPIADVKGAVNDLSAALSNPTAAIGNALSDALGGAFGGLMGGVGAAGPQKNPLSKFSSYNNIFTFGAIKRESFNDPDSTYRLTGPDVIVLQSGGSGNRQVRTQLEKAAGITGEYFIDDVEIKCLVAPGSKTKQTNATNISFNVMEPYSMGLFLQTLHIAAAQAGYTNYLECVYLLQVDFIGLNDRPLSS